MGTGSGQCWGGGLGLCVERTVHDRLEVGGVAWEGQCMRGGRCQMHRKVSA